MANTIGIVWTSDQRQLIADYHKRIAMLELENTKLKENATAARAASGAMTEGWKKTKSDIDDIRRREAIRHKEAMTNEQQYEKKLRDIYKLKKDGQLTKEQYRDAKKAYEEEYMAKRAVEIEERKTEAIRVQQKELAKARTERRQMEREAKQLIESTMTAQERHNASLARYDRLLKAGKITQEQYARAAARSAEATKEITKHPLQGMVNDIKGVAAMWLSVHSAIRLVGAEIENVKTRQKEAMDTQRPYGQKLFEVAKNYGPIDAATLTELDEKVRGISNRTGAKPTEVLDALNTALAGRVGGTVEDAVSATEMATKISRTPEAMGATARSYLTERAAYPDKTMGQIAGEQMVAKQLSPTDTDEAFAQHVGPHLATAKQFGNSYAEASALSAVIARRMADKEGRISTNAFITLEAEMAKRMPEIKGGTVDKLKALQSPEFADRKAHILGAMNSEWEERAAKAGPGESLDDPKSHLGGERKAFLALVALINQDKEAVAEFQDYLGQMPKTAKEAEAITENYVQLRTHHPLTRGADLQRRAEADIEREKLADPKAESAALREYLSQKTKAIGDSSVSQWMTSFNFERASGLGQRDAVKPLVEMLEQREAELRSKRWNEDGGDRRDLHTMGFDWLLGSQPQHDAPAADVEKADRIRSFLDRDLKPRLEPQPAPQAPPGPRVNVNVNVVMPGGGEKAPAVPAKALGQGG